MASKLTASDPNPFSLGFRYQPVLPHVEITVAGTQIGSVQLVELWDFMLRTLGLIGKNASPELVTAVAEAAAARRLRNAVRSAERNSETEATVPGRPDAE